MARARVPLGLIAVAAMLGSHWVAYMLAAPDPHVRAGRLESTGHGYWPSAMGFAVAAIFLGLGSFIAHRLSPAVRTSRQQIFTHALPRFLAVQIAGFTALEVVERLASGHEVSIHDLVASTFLVGVAIQFLAAFLSALLLVLVAFVVERFVSSTLRAAEGSTVSLP